MAGLAVRRLHHVAHLAVSATVLLFILVMVFQCQIVSGLTAGAVKG